MAESTALPSRLADDRIASTIALVVIIGKLLNRLEGTRMSAAEWLSGFFGALFLRYLLENISSPRPGGILTSDASTLIHYSLFYLTLTVALTLVLAAFSGRPVAAVSRLSLFCLPILMLPPILDLVLSGGAGCSMSYLFEPPYGLLRDLVTFFGPLTVPGITLGMRVEIALVLAGIFLFVRRYRGATRAFLAALTAYVVVFAWVAWPSLTVLPQWILGSGHEAATSASIVSYFLGGQAGSTATEMLHPSVTVPSWRAYELAFNSTMSRGFYFAGLGLACLWLWSSDRRHPLSVVRNSRPERVAHYFLLVLLGAGLAWSAAGDAQPRPIGIAVLTLLSAFYCAWMFAVGTNDLADLEIDRVSSPARPLPSGSLDDGTVSSVNLFFLLWSLVGGYLAGNYALFFILVFTAAYWTYSMPPLRLKRVPILATFLISLACLSAAMAGYFVVSGNSDIKAFPARAAALIIIAFTLGATVKDIKDFEGDGRGGIMTLPTLLGEGRGKKAVGALLCASFWLTPGILGLPILSPAAILFGIAAYIIVNRRPYREINVFLLYFAFVAVSTTLIMLSNSL
jgi:4-hydroxybenzoate polyprenyltransferase